ncbi:MAG: hypothetical protein JNK37_15550 [Verrucomicrobiales bacterium]|nr:hypothetical protein [Verrucomicrobiales bacterium]
MKEEILIFIHAHKSKSGELNKFVDFLLSEGAEKLADNEFSLNMNIKDFPKIWTQIKKHSSNLFRIAVYRPNHGGLTIRPTRLNLLLERYPDVDRQKERIRSIIEIR